MPRDNELTKWLCVWSWGVVQCADDVVRTARLWIRQRGWLRSERPLSEWALAPDFAKTLPWDDCRRNTQQSIKQFYNLIGATVTPTVADLPAHASRLGESESVPLLEWEWPDPLQQLHALLKDVQQQSSSLAWFVLFKPASLPPTKRQELASATTLFEQLALSVRRELGRAEALIRVADKLNAPMPNGETATNRQRRRRRQCELKPRPLTPKQVEAVQIVGECKGDFTAAARRLGIDRSSLKERYDAASKKMGKSSLEHRTQYLARDRRGQADVAYEDDRRHE